MTPLLILWWLMLTAVVETVWRKGDRYPYIEGQLSEGGVPMNCEAPINAVGIKVLIKPPAGAAKLLTAEWVEKKTGKWRYKQTKADTEGAGVLFANGLFSLEVVIEWEAGVLEHIGETAGGGKQFEITEPLA